jgi:hypothetical protein
VDKQIFDPAILTNDADRNLAFDIVGVRLHRPDVVLAPDGTPYLYRWHILYDNEVGNRFLHVQVASDPERPLHDHPWDNTSLILAGGYDELFHPYPDEAAGHWREYMIVAPCVRHLRRGDKASRPAAWAHRLVLPPEIPYSMTLFNTGPKVREWGFWYPDGWHHNKRHVDDRRDADGRILSIGEH